MRRKACPGRLKELMTDDPLAANDEALQQRLVELRLQHHDLDASVSALEHMPLPDQLLIARLKRRKLSLRDQIGRIEDQLTPDILA
jgi:hypothetical protein